MTFFFFNEKISFKKKPLEVTKKFHAISPVSLSHKNNYKFKKSGVHNINFSRSTQEEL